MVDIKENLNIMSGGGFHKITRKILDNGMHILYIPNKNTETVAMGFFTKVGSRYEDKKTNGLSHFLEHMIFKGTKKLSSKNLALKLDSVGAKYNAETSYETTHYYIYGHKNDAELFINIISEIYISPLFSEADIITERGVIMEEFNMVRDDPHEIIQNMMHESCFSNSYLKYPIIGNEKSIRSFTRSDFIAFRNKHYIPEMTVFAISGNFSNSHMKLIEKKLNAVQVSSPEMVKNADSFYYEEPKLFKGPQIIHKKNKGAQTNIIVTFMSEGTYSDNSDVYDLIGDILSSGSSSRLFTVLRGKLGITYFANAYNVAYAKEGAFAIHVGVDPERVNEAIDKIMSEVKKLRKNGVTVDELNKAKKIRITAFTTSLNTPQNQLSYYGLQELYYAIGNVPKQFIKKTDVNNRIKEYNDITLSQINKVIKELFTYDKMRIVVYGDAPDLDDKK